MSVKSPSVALASRATLSARRAPSIQSTAIARRCSEARQQQSASSSSRRVSAKADVFAYDTVTAVFTTFNTLLLLPWLLMVFLPNLDFTRSIIRSNIFLYVFCAMFLYLFVAATAEALNAGANLGDEIQFLFLEAVADPQKMTAMFSPDRPVYAAQDWAHLCTWDYFVGYWIYLQGQDKKIFTSHSLVLAFNSGPPGLLCHFLTESITNALRSNDKSLSTESGTPTLEASKVEDANTEASSTTPQ